MQHLFKGVAEFFTPVLTSSHFLEKGVLTPEEFVLAADQLVHTCPTWQWESGDPTKRKSFLPPDKQFLITRRVPCLRRVRALEYRGTDEADLVEAGDGDEEGWVATHSAPELDGTEDVPDIAPERTTSASTVEDIPDLSTLSVEPPRGMEDDCENVPDMEEFEEENLVVPDAAALPAPSYVVREEPEDTIMKTRTYDLSITYDKYYQTPRIWLFGYNENRQPLTPEQIFEDISQDHAKKTVTIEPHPHLSVRHASIHPCRHAAVMKKIVDHMCETGRQARVDQYLFIFLKFISAVTPTIEHDYTVEAEV